MKKIVIISMLLTSFCILVGSCSNKGKGSVSEENKGEECDSARSEAERDTVSTYTSKVEDGNLVIYTPEYSRVDLACGTMPSKGNKDVLYCAEAAFTGELLDSFRHSNIAGNHVSGGEFHKGYRCKRNTGAFVYYKGKYRFLFNNYDSELQKAADNGGMAFCQEMMIHNGNKVKTIRSASNMNMFRALCELDGRLCVIDCKTNQKFGDFIDELLMKGVTEALYLDMGPGWNYSWYRDKYGDAQEIHTDMTSYTTNWITFYK